MSDDPPHKHCWHLHGTVNGCCGARCEQEHQTIPKLDDGNLKGHLGPHVQRRDCKCLPGAMAHVGSGATQHA